MPKKFDVQAIQVGDAWRIIVPKDIRRDKETLWFQDEGKAKAKAAALQASRTEFGQKLFSLPQTELALVARALDKAGSPDALLYAVEFYRSQNPSEPIKLGDLIAKCVQSSDRANNSDHYIECLESTLTAFKNFVTDKGKKPEPFAHTVTPQSVEEFIHSNPKWSANTRINYRRDCRTLFSYAVANGYCAANPAAKVKKPKLEHEAPPKIHTVEEVEKMLRAAEKQDKGILRYLALCYFGGLRPSEAKRITKENIRAKYIDVSGKRSRDRNRRLVPINKTLRAWLDASEEIDLLNFRKRFDAVRKSAGVEWYQDVMRHSAVSYMVAIHGAKKTSGETGHSESILYNHYRERVTPEQAKAFWGIRPEL